MWRVCCMQHCLFAWFHGSLDWGPFDVVVKVTGKKVGQHQGGQQIDGVTWLAVDLLCTSCHSFGRLLIGVVLFFNDNTKPKKSTKVFKTLGSFFFDIFPVSLFLPEVVLELFIKVCWLALSLTAADLTRPLHRGPMDGHFTEEQPQAFRSRLKPPRGQMERDGQGLSRQDGRQDDRFYRR